MRLLDDGCQLQRTGALQVRDVFTQKTATALGGKVCYDLAPTSLRLLRIYNSPKGRAER